MSDDNINRIISVILFRGNTGCSWSTRPNYKNIVLMNNRLLIFLVAFFCKIDPITIFHMHFTNIQRAKCRNACIRIILRRLNYHAHAYICYITNSATRPFIKLGFRTKQFDKSGLAISQCIFYGKFSHCSDSPLRTALWCQFWHDRGAAAPVLSAFLCRWRVSPAFFGTYVDAPL